MKTLPILACLIAITPAAWSQAASTPRTHELSLRAADVPVPSLRYELLTSARDSRPGNAALLYHRALHLQAETRLDPREQSAFQDRMQKMLESPGRDFPRDEVRAFVNRMANVYRELDAAARCEACDWGIDERIAAEGIGTLLPDVQKLRELAFSLRLRTRLDLNEGKLESALGGIKQQFMLARHAAQGPTLIHFLVGTSIANATLDDLEQALQTPDCPNLYWSLTALPRPFLDLKRAMGGEARSVLATVPIPQGVDRGPMTTEEARKSLEQFWNGMSQLHGPPDKSNPEQTRLTLAAFVTLQHPQARKSLLAAGKTEEELDRMPAAQIVLLDALVQFRNIQDEYFVWFRAPFDEALLGIRQSQARLAQARPLLPLNPLPQMASLLMPALDRMLLSQLRIDRRIACLRIIEAVRLHASRNQGKLPATLPEITDVPLPRDPALAKPFPYTVEGNRFTLTAPMPDGFPPDRFNRWTYSVILAK